MPPASGHRQPGRQSAFRGSFLSYPVVCLVGREGAPWDSALDGAAAQVAGAGEDHFLQLLYRRRLHRSVDPRSEEHTSELQSLMRISYAVFCLQKKRHIKQQQTNTNPSTLNT